MSANPTLTNQKYSTRFGDRPESSAGADDEGAEDFGAFGLLRGRTDRSEMLELRKKTGNIRAIGYGWIHKVDFDASDGITLYAGGEKIRVKGRNLNALARQQTTLLGGIIRHRVPWISESGQSTVLQADNNTVLVEAIEW